MPELAAVVVFLPAGPGWDALKQVRSQACDFHLMIFNQGFSVSRIRDGHPSTKLAENRDIVGLTPIFYFSGRQCGFVTSLARPL